MTVRLPLVLFFILAMPVCASDLTRARIPDVLSLGGAVMILYVRALLLPESLLEVSAAGAALTGFFYAAWYFGAGLGRGDAKFVLLLVAGLGFSRGYAAVVFGLLLALAITLGARRRARLRPPQPRDMWRSPYRPAGLPFAPFLVLGAAGSHILIPEAG